MNSITQDMKYRQSLLTYAQKYGVSRASRKYNKSRSYICTPWPASLDVLIVTPGNTPRKNSNSSLICTEETQNLKSSSYGYVCEKEAILVP